MTDMDQNQEKTFKYQVQRILDRRIKDDRVEYYIKWKGYPLSQSTWEPLKNLTDSTKAILRFERTAKVTVEKRRKRRALLSWGIRTPNSLNRGSPKKERKKVKLSKGQIETITIESDEQVLKEDKKEQTFQWAEQSFVLPLFSGIAHTPQQKAQQKGCEAVLVSFYQLNAQKELQNTAPSHAAPLTTSSVESKIPSDQKLEGPFNEKFNVKYKSGKEVWLNKEEFIKKNPQKYEDFIKWEINEQNGQ